MSTSDSIPPNFKTQQELIVNRSIKKVTKLFTKKTALIVGLVLSLEFLVGATIRIAPAVKKATVYLAHKVAMADVHPNTELQDLEATTKYWQHAFHMDDWAIVMMPTTQAFITSVAGGVPADAVSQWNIEARTGTIYILRRDDYSPETMKRWGLSGAVDIKKDQANSIVHEMLHNVIEHADEEYAVVSIANLLSPE